jgi:hypothetical protein
MLKKKGVTCSPPERSRRDSSWRARTTRRLLALLAVGLASRASLCAAQARWPVSLEFSLGAASGGSSAPHGSSYGFSADALVGFRPGAHGTGGFVVAMSGSGEALGVHEASCDAMPGGTCTPDFPEFWMVSALAGWETGRGGARLLVGPALAISDSTSVGALRLRVDLAKPIFGRVSLLVSGRVAYIPDYGGDSFHLGSIGVGLRLW